MINEILLGFGLGVLWICFIAGIDSKLPSWMIKKRRIRMYILTTAWETLFFISGIIIGKYLL